MATEVDVLTYRARAFDDDPTVNDDSTKGFIAGSRWYNNTSKRLLICVDATTGNARWISATIPSANLECIRVNYVTNSTTYEQTGCSFPLMGDRVNVKSFKIVGHVDNNDPAYTYDVQIIDETHGNLVIVEATGLSGDTKTIHDLGTINNFPTTPSVLTINVRRSGTVSADLVHIYTLQIEYY